MFNPTLLTIGTIIATLGSAPQMADSSRALTPAAASTPQINAVSPASPAPGPEAQLIRIEGLDFLPGLELGVTGPDGAMLRIGGDEIRARTNTSFQATVTFAIPGAYTLIVTNRDGGVSPPFIVKTGAARAPNAPVIVSVRPADPEKRAEPQTLVVDGQRFDDGLKASVTDPMGGDVAGISIAKVTMTSFELTVALTMSGDYTLVVTSASGAVSNRMIIPVR